MSVAVWRVPLLPLLLALVAQASVISLDEPGQAVESSLPNVTRSKPLSAGPVLTKSVRHAREKWMARPSNATTLRTKPKANHTATLAVAADIKTLGVRHDELESMAQHGGEATHKRFRQLNVLFSTEQANGNATVAALPGIEKAAGELVESYLQHAKLATDPVVESTKAAVKKDKKSAEHLARERVILEQAVFEEKQRERGAAARKKYAAKIRSKAELVVKDAAKKQSITKRLLEKAKKEAVKVRPTTGSDKANAVNQKIQVVALQHRLSNLLLSRAEAKLAVQTNKYMGASDTWQRLKLKIAKRTSQEKATSVAQGVAVKAEKRAVVLERRTERMAENNIAKSAIQDATNEVSQSSANMQKKLTDLQQAVEKAKKGGNAEAQDKANGLSAKYDSLLAKSDTRKKELEDLKSKKVELQLQQANAAAGRTQRLMKIQVQNFTNLQTSLKVAKLRSAKAGRAVQREVMAAEKSPQSAVLKSAKTSMKHLEDMQEKVLSIQKRLAEKSDRVVHYKKEQKKAAALQSRAQRAANQPHDMSNIDGILKHVLAKAQSAQVNSAPGVMAVKEQAQSLAQGEVKDREHDQAELKKVKTALAKARAKQESAAKELPKSIRQYIIKARPTAPQKAVDVVTLDVTKTITAVQNAQVKVESLKAKKDRLLQKLQQDDAKTEREVEKKTLKLEQQIESATKKAADKAATNLTDFSLTSLKNVSALRIADRQVQDRKELAAQVESRGEELASRMKILKQDIVKASKEGTEEKTKILRSDESKLLGKLKGAKVDAVKATDALKKSEVRQNALKQALRVAKDSVLQVMHGTKSKPDPTPLDFASAALTDAAMKDDEPGMLNVLTERIETTMKAVHSNNGVRILDFSSLPLAKSAMGTNESKTNSILNVQIAATLDTAKANKTETHSASDSTAAKKNRSS